MANCQGLLAHPVTCICLGVNPFGDTEGNPVAFPLRFSQCFLELVASNSRFESQLVESYNLFIYHATSITLIDLIY